MDQVHGTLINSDYGHIFDIQRNWDDAWGDQIILDFAGDHVVYITQYPGHDKIYISAIWDHTFEIIPAGIDPDALWEKIMIECRPWFTYFRRSKETIREEIIAENNRLTAVCKNLYPTQSKLILHGIKLVNGCIYEWPKFKCVDEDDCSQFLQLAELLHRELPLPIAEEITAQLPARAPFDDYCYGRAPKNWDTVVRFRAEFDRAAAAAALEFPRAAKLFPAAFDGGKLCCVAGGPWMSSVEDYIARKNTEHGYDVFDALG